LENAPGYTGYATTRRAPDDPIVFGLEAMMYKGMKHGFTNGSTFDGNLDFTLLLQTNGGYTTELDQFRLTCLRLPAFPGAQGFGKWSQGGRGGEVYVVDNLNATGTGSLKKGMSDRKYIKKLDGTDSTRLLPRTIVFREGGEIVLNGTDALTAEKGSVTIAGQSAPGSGITIRSGSLKIGKSYTKDGAGNQVLPDAVFFRQASDFNIRYLRVRRTQNGVPSGGSIPANPDALGISSATRTIIDHCSFAWGADGTMDINVLERPKNSNGNPGGSLPNEQPEMDITFQWCLANQTLEDHSKALVWRGKYGGRYSLLNCFLSNNRERNPVFAHLGDAVSANPVDSIGCFMEAVNNAVYNWADTNAGTMNQSSDHIRLQFRNNYYKPGGTPALFSYGFEILGSPKVYFAGNEWNGAVWSNWHQYVNEYETAIPLPSKMESEVYGVISASDNTGNINAHGGASRGRDAADTAFIADLLAPGLGGNSGGGVVLNVPPGLWNSTSPPASGPSDGDGDGMPDVWENAHSSGPATDLLPWKDVDGDGWSNLEEYLNGTSPEIGNDPLLEQSSSVLGTLETK
jgi:hypothetical protein